MAVVANALAERLRVETAALHLEAERSGYVQEILKRRATKAGYALYLRSLLPAYDALERALVKHAGIDSLALFDWRKLHRGDAIIADLTVLESGARQETRPYPTEAQAYPERIDKVSAEAPERLIGHAYVRYIGDLSGGQIVKNLLARTPGLTPDMLGFYDFPAIKNAEAYKDGFRATLDHAGLIANDADAIVDEAKRAFRLNIDLSLAVLQSIRSFESSTTSPR